MARKYPRSSPDYILTDATTITVDAAAGDRFIVTLTATGHVIGIPSNPSVDQMIIIQVKQGGTGSYTYSFDSIFQFTVGNPFPATSTAVGAVDIFGFKYNATAGKWWCLAHDVGHT